MSSWCVWIPSCLGVSYVYDTSRASSSSFFSLTLALEGPAFHLLCFWFNALLFFCPGFLFHTAGSLSGILMPWDAQGLTFAMVLFMLLGKYPFRFSGVLLLVNIISRSWWRLGSLKCKHCGLATELHTVSLKWRYPP